MTVEPSDIVIRAARPDDLEAIAGVSLANDEPVSDPDRPGSRYLEHLLRHARLLVAEARSGVVGFAASIDVPTGRFLTDLFVDPAEQGRGIGRALLAEALPASGPRMTFSSADPRALPIYVRAGLAPWWPLLYLAAPRGARRLEGSAIGSDRLAIDAIDGADAAELELRLTGDDRSRDWAFWADGPGRTAFRVSAGRGPAAVGLIVGDRLGRLAIAAEADPVAAVRSVVGWRLDNAAVGGSADGIRGLAIPGPHPAVPALLDAGWRVEGSDTCMASGPDLLDPTRLLPDPSLA